MTDQGRPVCPIPSLGYCVFECCSFWNEKRQECSGLCLGEYSPLEETLAGPTDSPCTIHWTEDYD